MFYFINQFNLFQSIKQTLLLFSKKVSKKLVNTIKIHKFLKPYCTQEEFANSSWDCITNHPIIVWVELGRGVNHFQTYLELTFNADNSWFSLYYPQINKTCPSRLKISLTYNRLCGEKMGAGSCGKIFCWKLDSVYYILVAIKKWKSF